MRKPALALALLVTLGAHAPLFLPPRVVQVGDEGYIGAFAWRMAEGRMLPYVDAVSHRGPLVYFPPAIATWIIGGGSALPMRLCALVFVVLATLLLLVTDKRRGPIAAVSYAAACGIFVPAWIAYHSEHVINVLALGAFVLTARRRWLGLAGALAMSAFLCKPVAIFVVLALGLWIPRRSLLAYALGALAPLALCGIRYAIAGELSTFVYYFYSYNRVYMAPYTGGMALAQLASWVRDNAAVLLVLFAAIAVALYRAFRGKKSLVQRYEDDGWTITVALMSLGSLVAAKAPLRDFIHYYLAILPWFTLLVAHFAIELFERFESARIRGALVLALAALGVVLGIRGLQKRSLLFTNDNERVCELVEKNSTRKDALFVWGFEPWDYIDCRRKPASRYVFTTFVMGYVPWFDESPETERARVSPRSRETLLRELEDAKPAVIIDAPIGWRAMDRYPDLKPFLRSYCLLETLGTRRVYVSSAKGHCGAGF